MKVILDKKLINEKGLKDFDLDPVNKDLVAVGKKLYFVSQDLEGKEIIKELTDYGVDENAFKENRTYALTDSKKY